MREVDLIVVHCSASPPSMDIGAREIDTWHRKRGYLRIGYHFVIRRDGTVEEGRPVEEAGAHAQGHNRNSIGVCLVGGVEEDNSTPADNFADVQKFALRALLDSLLAEFPGARLVGHRDLPGVTKACPSFDVRDWYSNP